MRKRCVNNAYVYVGKFVDFLAFAEALNRPYINVLYMNSLWCTDSRRTAFGCSPNVCRTAECCLPRLGNTSTSNVRIVFECRVCVRILFAFRCKCGFRCHYNDLVGFRWMLGIIIWILSVVIMMILDGIMMISSIIVLISVVIMMILGVIEVILSDYSYHYCDTVYDYSDVECYWVCTGF